MSTIRMLPPSAGPLSMSPIAVNGRTFNPTAAAYQDVADFDADKLEANGWTRLAETGPTTARPTAVGTSQQALRGRRYIDTDVGAMLEHDGIAWRNVATGAIA